MTKDNRQKPTPALLFIVQALFAFIVSIMTVQLLWNWFIVPLGAVKLSFAHSFGLMLVLSWFTNIKENQNYSMLFLNHIIKSALVLIVGFILKSFI